MKERVPVELTDGPFCTSALASEVQRPHALLRVLVIDGHPRSGSFGSALAETVARAAANRKHECRSLQLRELGFDPHVHGTPLEPALRAAQADIVWAELIIFVYPTWWGTTPALLKGFLDRVLHADFGFAERSDGGWRGLLEGRAALLVTTMDTPRWIYRWLLGAPGHRAMRDATLGFCGIEPVKILSFGPVRSSTLGQRRLWLARVAREGRSLNATFRTGWRVKFRAWLAVSRLHFFVQPLIAYTMGAVAASLIIPSAWHWPGYLLGYIGIFLIEFITVTTNELADLPSDRVNANASALTGGSRILVRERLTIHQVRYGRRLAVALFAAVLLCSLWLVPHALALVAVSCFGLVLGVGYSTPPLRFCAKGLGEVTVAVTHSFLVVVAGYTSQGGPALAPGAWLLALPLCLAVLPSITLAGFPDFEADEATGKRTLAVRLGRSRAGSFAACCAGAAAISPLFLGPPVDEWLQWVVPPATAHALWISSRIRRFIQEGTPSGRIDALLALALTFMLWFCVIPLGAMLLNVR